MYTSTRKKLLSPRTTWYARCIQKDPAASGHVSTMMPAGKLLLMDLESLKKCNPMDIKQINRLREEFEKLPTPIYPGSGEIGDLFIELDQITDYVVGTLHGGDRQEIFKLIREREVDNFKSTLLSYSPDLEDVCVYRSMILYTELLLKLLIDVKNALDK